MVLSLLRRGEPASHLAELNGQPLKPDSDSPSFVDVLPEEILIKICMLIDGKLPVLALAKTCRVLARIIIPEVLDYYRTASLHIISRRRSWTAIELSRGTLGEAGRIEICVYTEPTSIVQRPAKILSESALQHLRKFRWHVGTQSLRVNQHLVHAALARLQTLPRLRSAAFIVNVDREYLFDGYGSLEAVMSKMWTFSDLHDFTFELTGLGLLPAQHTFTLPFPVEALVAQCSELRSLRLILPAVSIDGTDIMPGGSWPRLTHLYLCAPSTQPGGITALAARLPRLIHLEIYSPSNDFTTLIPKIVHLLQAAPLLQVIRMPYLDFSGLEPGVGRHVRGLSMLSPSERSGPLFGVPLLHLLPQLRVLSLGPAQSSHLRSNLRREYSARIDGQLPSSWPQVSHITTLDVSMTIATASVRESLLKWTDILWLFPNLTRLSKVIWKPEDSSVELLKARRLKQGTKIIINRFAASLPKLTHLCLGVFATDGCWYTIHRRKDGKYQGHEQYLETNQVIQAERWKNRFNALSGGLTD